MSGQSPSVRDERATLRLPPGKSVAVWVGIHVEHWSLLPPAGSFVVKGLHGNWPDHFPDYRTFSFREYGNRIGIFRLFDVLGQLGITPSVIINAEAICRYPAIVEEAARHGADFILQGGLANRMITSAMTDEEERVEIRNALALYRAAFGTPAAGWMSPEGGKSARTLQFLAEAGIRFVLDWPSEEIPHVFATDPPLLSIPYQWEFDDLDLLWTRNSRPWNYDRIIISAFRELARCSRDGCGRLLGLHARPWLLGQPARVGHFRTLLTRLKEEQAAAFLTVSQSRFSPMSNTRMQACPASLLSNPRATQ